VDDLLTLKVGQQIPWLSKPNAVQMSNVIEPPVLSVANQNEHEALHERKYPSTAGNVIVSCAQINTVSYTAFAFRNVTAASRGERKFGNTAGAIG